jgi:hypothetical protein
VGDLASLTRELRKAEFKSLKDVLSTIPAVFTKYCTRCDDRMPRKKTKVAYPNPSRTPMATLGTLCRAVSPYPFSRLAVTPSGRSRQVAI